MHHFEKEGWTCDDCKVCLVCGESQTNVSARINVYTVRECFAIWIVYTSLAIAWSYYHVHLLFQEDLIICEYCDEGVHYTCLDPPPQKRPKVWDCDDCLVERGKQPNNNVRKRKPGERNLPRITTTSHLITSKYMKLFVINIFIPLLG